MSIEQITERDLAYVADTRELIKDVLASNNIPDDIVLTALTSVIIDRLLDGTKGPSEFARRVTTLCDRIEHLAVQLILFRSTEKPKKV